jgi:hypothetical protein
MTPFHCGKPNCENQGGSEDLVPCGSQEAQGDYLESSPLAELFDFMFFTPIWNFYFMFELTHLLY